MSIERWNLGTSTRYRVNPKLPSQVEWQMPSGRWQIVQACRTPAEARALVAKLAADTQEAR